MRCTQRDKGQVQDRGQDQGQDQDLDQDLDLDQDQDQDQDHKVLKQGWESMEAPLASHTHLHLLTIRRDTHNGCRLTCEKVVYKLFGFAFYRSSTYYTET